MMWTNTKTTIILVEDDAGHAQLIQINLQRADLKNDIIVLSDGQKAVDYIFGEGEFLNHERPQEILVLLDLNLPVVDGYQVLKKIKEDPKTKHIPVIVLTSTDENHEIAKCYEMGCNLCVTKPVEYHDFADVIHKLGQLISALVVS